MISLKTLFLEEKTTQPMAIFMAGSAGAGKSSFRKTYIDKLGNFEVLNIDDIYEPLLKQSDLPLDFRKYTSPEQLSAAGIAMGKAQKAHKDKYTSAKTNLQNIVIDGTGASSREILKKKKELEELGYKTMMILIFVPPDVSLYRNLKRGSEGGRTLMPSIILRSWSSLFDNIETYKTTFGENLIIYKAYKEKDVQFPEFDPEHPNVRKMFYEPFKVKGKEKSPEDKAKAIEKMKSLNQQIRTQVSKIADIEFDDPQEIQTKLNRFANA